MRARERAGNRSKAFPQRRMPVDEELDEQRRAAGQLDKDAQGVAQWLESDSAGRGPARQPETQRHSSVAMASAEIPTVVSQPSRKSRQYLTARRQFQWPDSRAAQTRAKRRWQ